MTPVYTDAIVTLVWMDGYQRTPPILFSRNPAFQSEDDYVRRNEKNPRRKATAISQSQRKKLERLRQSLQRFDIEEGCVIYHTAAKHSHFCREDEWMLVRYFELVEDWLPKDAIIFRDEGKAYDTCFSKIQASAGIDKVIVYPPAVHELLSPNDNKVHGIAKERWRRCDFYKKDAVESSLSLLHFLRNVDGESISTFFTENFFYNSRTSFTKAEVEKVVMTSGKRRYQRINFFHDCEQLYERFIRGHYARGTQVQPTPPLSLDCDLDGDYWTVFRVL